MLGNTPQAEAHGGSNMGGRLSLPPRGHGRRKHCAGGFPERALHGRCLARVMVVDFDELNFSVLIA